MTAEPTSAPEHETPFLTASWRDLVMITWAMDPLILHPLLPEGTELDLWEGQALASVVAFDFANTRVLGLAIPFHRRFPEVNLRFYIRRRMPGGSVRRGVAFVQEMVPRAAIAWTARVLYGEPYVARRMRHVAIPPKSPGDIAPTARSLVYEWRRDGQWERVIALVPSSHQPTREGTLEQFIVDHRWGYTRRPGKPTLEYRVEHPPWRLALDAECRFEADINTIYGKRFAQPLERAPVSTFVADGSDVAVYRGRPVQAS